jgi:hypothetical protein
MAPAKETRPSDKGEETASRPADWDRGAERVRRKAVSGEGSAALARGREEPARPKGRVRSSKDRDRAARVSHKAVPVRAGTPRTSVRDKEPQRRARARVKGLRAKAAKRKAASARIKDRVLRDKDQASRLRDRRYRAVRRGKGPLGKLARDGTAPGSSSHDPQHNDDMAGVDVV